MKGYFRRLPAGQLAPDDDETLEAVNKIKVGSVIRVEYKQVRNYKFLQKTHCMFRLVFDYWCEKNSGRFDMQYKGQKVTTNYDTFRRNLVVLAGHYTATYNIRGEVRLEAKSLSFANCTEEEAEKIYSDCINAALTHVPGWAKTEKEIRDIVDRLLAYT